MDNKRTIIYEFRIFEFSIFLFSNIAILAYFDIKITIFISEITLKLLLYGWNNIQNMDEITLTEVGWAWKIQNFTFLTFLAAQNSS